LGQLHREGFIIGSQETRRSPEVKPGLFYGYIIVLAAFFIMLVMFGVYNTFGIFSKPVLTEFGWTRAITSGAFSLSWILYGLLGIVMGRLTDRLGPRIVLTFCGFLVGLGYLLMSQITAVWQLYLFYGVIIGTGMCGFFVPLTSTAARWFVKRRSMMSGIVLSGMGIGTLIMSPVTNWLISTYDWRQSYTILGSVVLVLVILAAQPLRRDPAQMRQVPYGENAGEEQGLGTSGLSLREAIYTGQFWLVSAQFFCLGFCIFTILVHIAPHAIEVGLSAASAANILATIGGCSIIGKVILGSAADRIGNRLVFLIGFFLMAAILFWIAKSGEVWELYLFAVIFGVAYGGCAASEAPLVAALFGLRFHGLILGVINFGFTIGAAVGPFLAGYIFDISESYEVAFLVCTAISVIGIIFTALIKPIKVS